MAIGRLDAKDRLRIPRQVREAMGLRAGDAVFYALVDGELRIRRAEDPYADYGPVARQVLRDFEQHPERWHSQEQVLKKLGITEADLNAVPDLDDEGAGGG